jgi:hypothetical protein
MYLWGFVTCVGGEVVVDEAFPSNAMVGEEHYLDSNGELCCFCPQMTG